MTAVRLYDIGYSGYVGYIGSDEVPHHWEVSSGVKYRIVPLLRDNLYDSLARRATV